MGVFGVSFGHNVTQNLPVLANQSLNPAQPWLSVFTLATGAPPVLDPSSILASQPKGPNGYPILPNGIAPNVLPLTSGNTMRLPVVDAWNFTLEHQFSQGTVLSVAYVGNKGYHVTPGGTNYNINQPPSSASEPSAPISAGCFSRASDGPRASNTSATMAV